MSFQGNKTSRVPFFDHCKVDLHPRVVVPGSPCVEQHLTEFLLFFPFAVDNSRGKYEIEWFAWSTHSGSEKWSFATLFGGWGLRGSVVRQGLKKGLMFGLRSGFGKVHSKDSMQSPAWGVN